MCFCSMQVQNQQVRALTALTHLSLESATICRDPSAPLPLEQLSHLQSCELAGSAWPQRQLQCLPSQLTRLALIRTPHVVSVQPLSTLSCLAALTIASATLKQIPMLFHASLLLAAFCWSVKMHGLQLRGANISSFHASAPVIVEPASRRNALRAHEFMIRCPLVCAEVTAPPVAAELQCLTALTYLSVSGVRPGSSCAGVASCKNLQALCLSKCALLLSLLSCAVHPAVPCNLRS